MKRAAKAKRDPDMLEEYDFGKGVRGKYAKRYARGTNVVLLAPDVAEFFPDSESVNAALRALVGIARKRVKKTPVQRALFLATQGGTKSHHFDLGRDRQGHRRAMQLTTRLRI